jgi:hypothetical protein
MSMPAESIVELIQQQIKTTLQGITTASGYWHTVGTVVRGRLSPLDHESLPLVSILPVSDVPEAGASSVLRRELTLTLRLWIEAQAFADAPTQLERLKADVTRAMQLDPRRGGLAEDTRELAYQYLYLQGAELLAGADIGYAIVYRTRIGDSAQGPT